MSTLNAQYLTLLDLGKQMQGHDDIQTVIELLAQFNPILEDAPAEEVIISWLKISLPLSFFGCWKIYELSKPLIEGIKKLYN